MIYALVFIEKLKLVKDNCSIMKQLKEIILFEFFSDVFVLAEHQGKATYGWCYILSLQGNSDNQLLNQGAGTEASIVALTRDVL